MYKYHRNTSTRNSGSDETVKDSLACAVTPNNDQRSGRYYSDIYATQYYLLQCCQNSHDPTGFFSEADTDLVNN
jgi:hypothetical protein